MNKKIIITIIIGILIIGVSPILLIIAKKNGAIQFYTIPGSGSEPTIKSGSFLLGSNLIAYKNLDFIIHNHYNNNVSEIWTHRLCGMEGDTIQIINGFLFINNINIDSQFILKHKYIMSRNHFSYLQKAKLIAYNSYYIPINDDSIAVDIANDDPMLTSEIKRYIQQDSNKLIIKHYQQLWTDDNFGPITVPKGYVFVLGDNRNNSLDSRHIGFIKTENIKGVVLMK